MKKRSKGILVFLLTSICTINIVMAEVEAPSNIKLIEIKDQAYTSDESDDDDGDIIPPGEKPFSYFEWFKKALKEMGI